MLIKIRFSLLLFISLLLNNAFALTSIATVSGHVDAAWYRVSNYESQSEADAAALEGCRTEARKNGIGNLARKCKVISRAKAPGYGAIVCGDDGCSWVIASESGQSAIDAAYERCSKSYKNCQERDINFWEDFAGFSRKKSEIASGGDCRPRTNILRCQSRCTNGDCILTYENGCKMRTRINPNFNPISNQWEYPAPSC